MTVLKKERKIMQKEEIQGFTEAVDVSTISEEMLDNMIGMLMLDPIAYKNFANQIAKMPFLIKDAYYWSKFHLFVTGVKSAEKELGEGVKLSNKLFNTSKNKRQNGMRLLGYIDKADSEQKINYYVNATKSLLLGLIDNTGYFRIMKALMETLNEDLEYLADIAIKEDVYRGNMQLLALERSGLVLQAVFDANESVENQSYVISSLGKYVDRFAVSFEDEERQKFYKMSCGEIDE